MDFSFDEQQVALRDLAKRILEEQATVERIRAVERAGTGFDRALWSELARAELLGIALPPENGGSGMGLIELCLLLEQAGRTIAPVPLLAALVMGALPVATFGSDEQRSRLLPGVARGDVLLTAALIEPDSDLPHRPRTTATRDGQGWRLNGVKHCVPAAHLARRILVFAATGADSIGAFLVDPEAVGIRLERQVSTALEPQWRLELEDVFVPHRDLLGDPDAGAAIVRWLVDRVQVGLCALELGIASRALEITAKYTSTRQQFDRPIATFQAVAQRAADAWIDVEAVRVTLWQAAWRLSEGLEAAKEVAVAKFWAAEGGHRAVYAAQHLHGGIGVDLDYPLHRYYLWSRQIELTLGGANGQLARLGALLACDDDDARTGAQRMARDDDDANTAAL